MIFNAILRSDDPASILIINNEFIVLADASRVGSSKVEFYFATTNWIYL
jgi:hypothetical protein